MQNILGSFSTDKNIHFCIIFFHPKQILEKFFFLSHFTLQSNSATLKTEYFKMSVLFLYFEWKQSSEFNMDF